MIFTRTLWRGVLAVLATVGFVLTAFPIVAAQDLDAVQNRLLKAVKNDELSLRQAAAMMDALEEFKHNERRRIDEELYHAERELKEQVNAGRIDKADAKRRIVELKRRLLRRGEVRDHEENMRDDDADSKEKASLHRFNVAVQKIERAVISGRLTQADAEKRISKLKEEMFGKQTIDPRVEKYEQAVAKIKAASENGRISKSDAEEKVDEVRKRIFKRQPEIAVQKRVPESATDELLQLISKLKKRIERVRGAVGRGQMSKEQALKTFERLQGKFDVPLLVPDAGFDRDENEGRAGERRPESEDQGTSLNEARRRIRQAVQDGSMEPDEAREKLRKMESGLIAEPQTSPNRVKPEVHRDLMKNVRQQIESALVDRLLSDDEANALRAELKKRMGKQDKR